MTASATMRIRFVHVTLAQLVDELHKFQFAGWGHAELEFNTSLPQAVEVKMYRQIPTPTPPKGSPK